MTLEAFYPSSLLPSITPTPFYRISSGLQGFQGSILSTAAQKLAAHARKASKRASLDRVFGRNGDIYISKTASTGCTKEKNPYHSALKEIVIAEII